MRPTGIDRYSKRLGQLVKYTPKRMHVSVKRLRVRLCSARGRREPTTARYALWHALQLSGYTSRVYPRKIYETRCCRALPR